MSSLKAEKKLKTLPVVEPVSAADSAYEILLQAIVSGQMQAGDKLTEEALCRELSVSRTPLREALLRLEHEGLVERRARCGCRVKELNREEIAEIFECRAILECEALSLGFDRIDENEIALLLEFLTDISGKNEKEQLAMSLKADDRLHGIIRESCPNNHLKKLVADVQFRTLPFRNARSFGSGNLKKISDERIAILQSIKNHNLKKTRELLRSHILLGNSN